MNVEKIRETYKKYYFDEDIEEHSNYFIVANVTGISPYGECIYWSKEEPTLDSETYGFEINKRRFESIEELEQNLFELVFKKNAVNKKQLFNYQSFINGAIFKSGSEQPYEYIQCSYTKNGESYNKENSIIDSIKSDIISTDNSKLILIEAAAGFGKTCTAYELMNSLINDEKFIGIPLLTELGRNKTARIFRYVLLDEVNRTIKSVDVELTTKAIQDGRICVIIDGFDELIHKDSQSSSKKSFENAESMLDTIKDLLHKNAKVVITTRRTSIFDGEEFQQWIDRTDNDFIVSRYRIMEPKIEDWIGHDKAEKITSLGIDIKKIVNPVLLTYIRYMKESEFFEVIEKPGEIITRYIDKMLNREMIRQSIEIKPDEQSYILMSIAHDMLINDYTQEHKDYISKVISNNNKDILTKMITNSDSSSKVDFDSLVKTIRGHAFLDKKGKDGNQIGFVNDFILGHYCGKALKEYNLTKEDLIVSGIFVESIFQANSVSSPTTKSDIWDRLEYSFDCLSTSDKLSFGQIIRENIDFNLSEDVITALEFSDIHMFTSSQANLLTFNDCTFSNVTFYKENLVDTSFINCRFYNCRYSNNSVVNSRIFFIKCLFDENSNNLNIQIENKEESKEPEDIIFECKSAILEKFWPNGKEKAFKHRPLSIINGLTKQFELPVFSRSMTELYNEGVLENANNNSNVQRSDDYTTIKTYLRRT
ncbi:hypothetical protein [Aeromonas caviae]|uniref:hypothetical protein n=1 Tax=Aeromonas caviae TaxID=648 RepID=UPI002B45939F|nr:hypothetical protein [Aeromonas caviae]